VMRKIRAQGGFAYLVRRGAQEAGAVFIVQRDRESTSNLYGPAPQSFYEADEEKGARLFTLLLAKEREEKIQTYLEKELRFDPDIWIVEIENVENLADAVTLVDMF